MHSATLRALAGAAVFVALGVLAWFAWGRLPWGVDLYAGSGGMAPIATLYVIFRISSWVGAWSRDAAAKWPQSATTPNVSRSRKVAAILVGAVYIAGAWAVWRYSWIGLAIYITTAGAGPILLGGLVVYCCARIWGLRSKRIWW